MNMSQHNGHSGRNGHLAGFAKGFLIGGLLGAAVGLLKAPQSGSKTRELVQEKASDLQDKAQQRMAEARSRVDEAAGQVSQEASELHARGGDALDESEKHLSRAVEETQKAAKAIQEI
jgi:gas vesicle protein